MTTQVIAHRGASRAEPENTLAAYRRAGTMGADGVELDVRRSVDGALIVHHDAQTADGRLIAATPAAALPDWMPTLEAALDACAGMWVNIEIKNDPDEADFDAHDTIADAVIATLVARGELQRWLISSFRLETIDRCRALAPQIRTAWLTDDASDASIARCVDGGHSAIHPWVGQLGQDDIERCHAAGIEVNTWTVDDPQRLAELIAWGIDGVCTNEPDVAVRVRAVSSARP